MEHIATVAVEATAQRHRALQHMPSGIGFEEDGTARWPADQFTFRMRDEGAIRLLEDLHDPGGKPEKSKYPAKPKARQVKTRAKSTKPAPAASPLPMPVSAAPSPALPSSEPAPADPFGGSGRAAGAFLPPSKSEE